MKTRILIVLIALLSIVVYASTQDTTYNEAPMLAEMVEAGDLPPVEERLPVNPLVQEVKDSIGQYGGTLVSYAPRLPDCDPETCSLLNANIAQFDYDFNIVPDIAESWELSEDGLIFTVTLREGHRWSDGELLTTEDVQFWYDAVVLTEEVFLANTDNGINVNGQIAELEIINDYTFRFIYPERFVRVLDTITDFRPFLPEHYLSQFHAAYNDEADALAQEAGFDFWYEHFMSKLLGGTSADPYFTVRDQNLPVLAAWMYESHNSQEATLFVRNPYYHVVDPEGNQLPYVDYFDRRVETNNEVLKAQIVSGEATHAAFWLAIGDFTLHAENSDSNDFIVNLHPDLRASEFGFVFNYTHPDPVLAEIFNDIRFRQAMSHAINRPELQELVFLGQGTPRQPIFDPTTSFYEEGIDQNAIEFDVEIANSLLDEMGLEMGPNDIRLRPDGESLEITFTYATNSPLWNPDLVELVREYWGEVGVDLVLDPVDINLYRERLDANDTDMGTWAIGGSSEVFSRNNSPIRYRPPFHFPTTPLGGLGWYQWYASNGEDGVAPPQEVQDLYVAIDAWMQEPRGTERYAELGTEIMRTNAENLWLIGTIGLMPRPVVLSTSLRNTPTPEDVVSVEFWVWGPHQPEQWYFDN
ncbi:MAG: ABC transporter substrate-binding protein [Aggregatilineales bacterium]